MDVAREIVTLLTNAVWQISVVALIAYLCGWPLRRAPGRIQHRYWACVLCLSVLLPLVSLAEPRLMSLLFTPELGAPTWQASGMPGAKFTLPASGMIRLKAQAGWINNQTNSWLVLSILVVYSIFFLWSGVRLLASWRKLKRLLGTVQSGDLPPRALEIARWCQAQLGVSTVSIVISPFARSIFAAGSRRPKIVLPEGMAQSMSVAELQVALSHEMAHILRRDFFWNTLLELVTSPLAFHPAVRWIKQRMIQTREMACDELAAQTLDSRRAYCQGMISLAQRTLLAASAGPALAIFDGNHLEERIMQLISQSRPSKRAVLLASVLSAVVLMTVSMVCTAFAFQAKPGTPAVTGQELVGTWKADFKGQTYWIVRVSSVKPTVEGTFSNAENVSIGEDGTVKSVDGIEGLNRSSKMLDPHLEGNHLTFKWQDGDDLTTLRMTITGPDTANLMILAMPDPEDQAELGKFKGFPLKRVKTSDE